MDARRPTQPPDTGFAHLDRARSVRIETPEHVRLGFELAGLGSRSAAVIADLMVIGLAVTVVVLLLRTLDYVVDRDWVLSLVGTAGVLTLFVVQWGYFFISEGFFGGRTLGKRWIGIRAVGAAGTPITLQAAALRNLLRIIDFQPLGSSALGLGIMVLHPRGQRLGDIVAGTVVVRDRGSSEIPEEKFADRSAERPYLDPQRFDVLERYVQRRDGLAKEVRTRLAGRVARAMGPLVENHPRRTTTRLDDLLTELYEQERPRQSYGLGTTPQAVHLVRSQSASWARCRALVDKAGGRGLNALTEDELAEFTTLYRELVADLARAQTYRGSLRLRFHLERLAAEAHNLFYRGRTEGFSLREWLRHGFPDSFRRHGAYIAVAAGLLFVPALVAYAGVRADPELGRRLAPPSMVTRAEEAGDRVERGDPYIDVPTVQMSVFSSRIMTNNLQVSFLAAAGGILLGVGTAFILLFNGVHLGSVFALYDVHGAGSLLWVFVLPHGVLELTAIVVSGGAGLVLAHAIVSPGRRTRARALVEQGRAALSLVAGAGVFLVIAGVIEGFVSPARIPAAPKVAFATAVALLMVGYLSRRRAERIAPAPPPGPVR